MPKPPLFGRLLQGAALVGVVTASAVLGLAVSLAVPLPMGLVAGDQAKRSLDDWQTGLRYRASRPVNILVMGIDRVPDAKPDSDEIFQGRSDTMLLLRVDPLADTVSILAIPRDTQVEIPGVGVTKINDANVEGGAGLAALTTSDLLNGVTIDRYVRVSTEALRELVDRLDGIEVYVPKPMSYTDQTQKLKIELSKGLQTLNGDQAEQFARFRQDAYGDIGRVQRQQILLKALLKKLQSADTIPRIPGLIQTMKKYVDTNLSFEEMLALASAGRRLSDGNFKLVMLPGRFSSPDEFTASYWIMDAAGRDRVMRQYFDVKSVESVTDPSNSLYSLRIAVQNASSHPYAASHVRSYLSKLGFYNVYLLPDRTNEQSDTQIVVQRGDLKAGTGLKNVLGLGLIDASSTGDLDSDLTIRVGNDWEKYEGGV